MEEEILNYLHPKKVYLKVLDNKYKEPYTGVSLSYITYNLLKAKYRKSDVANMLLQLHKEEKIKSLYCGNVENYVFMSWKCHYWNFSSKNGESYSKKYNLHKYLKQFIKNE